MQMASSGEILKNEGSNRSIESTKLPSLQYGAPADPAITQSVVLQRDTFLTRSFPSLRFCQNSSSDSDSANRPLMPMMAMRSAPRSREPLSDDALPAPTSTSLLMKRCSDLVSS